MKHATSQDCAEALLHGWISRFGVLDNITSDRRPAFTSQLWKSLGDLMGTNIHHTTAYNPAANGHSPADNNHLATLRQTVGKYRPCIQTYKKLPPRHLPELLHTCKYVFVRNDAHRSPFTRPYRGPYAVLERNPKAYRLSIAGRSDWVSIDRLKPAYVYEEDPPSSSARAGGPPHTPPHKNGPASTSTREDGPRLASSRTGQTIRQPHRLNL
ncbi:uncharacterized protein LOC135092005 [Scylla paramamosain]|uniref:uncharacterized protein LOC135092005 n=1 Tax=Scylla paramamosain TaxID=85552 RepID=UPI0030828D8A